MSSISALPPELLLEIFRYLSPEELLDSVQNVCITWRQLAIHASLWGDLVYCPERDLSCKEFVRFVEKCPLLKHIRVHITTLEETEDTGDIVSAVIRNCSDLRTFRVVFSEDFFTITQIDAIFKAFPNLEAFTISINSQNARQVVNRTSKCKNLKKLSVEMMEYCVCSLKPIVNGCASLDDLYIGWPKIVEDEYLYILNKMKDRLRCLRFSMHQPGTQKVVDALGSFTMLEYLDLLHKNNYGPVNFLPLASIKTLRCFKFVSQTCTFSEVETIFDVLFSNPYPLLWKLAISFDCAEPPRNIVKDICRCYPNLKHLQLRLYSFFRRVKDTFENISNLKHLESLTYSNSDSITDDDTKHIARCCGLKHLDLKLCVGLTDKTLFNLTNCKSLESLNLSCCSISGQNLHLISEHLNKLRYLNVFGITAEQDDLILLAKQMPLTKVLF